MRRRLSAAGTAVLLLALAGCSSSGHEPSGHTSPTAAPPSGPARQGGGDLVDPSVYRQSVSGAKTLLDIRGKGDSSPSVPEAEKSGDLVIAVSCSGKGPLKVADKSGRLLLGIATCEGSPGAIYNSRGSLRPDDAALRLTTDAAVAWRIAALRAPHA